MDNPELYIKAQTYERADTTETLNIFKSYGVIPFLSGEKILDIGCGPGAVTSEVLGSFLGENFKVVGCDISEKMVNYAQARYGNDQFSFKKVDIGDENVTTMLDEGSFDKIYSFYCLHWVPNLEQAIKNIYNLLKTNGYLITLFVLYHPFFVVYNQVKKDPKWKEYTESWNGGWIALYDKNTANSQEEFIKMLKNTGFQVHKFVVKEKSCLRDEETFFAIFESVNPHMSKIPAEKREEFIADSKNHLLEMGYLKITEDRKYKFTYSTITTLAKKSDEEKEEK